MVCYLPLLSIVLMLYDVGSMVLVICFMFGYVIVRMTRHVVVFHRSSSGLAHCMSGYYMIYLSKVISFSSSRCPTLVYVVGTFYFVHIMVFSIILIAIHASLS
jgi:hypothetical protein